MTQKPTSWKPMFEFRNDGWHGNAQRFATQEEALSSAASRFNQWIIPTGYRADPSDDPVNYLWDAQKGDMFVNRELEHA